MRDKNDSYMSEDPWKEGREWTWSFLTCQNFHIRFQSFWRGHAASAMLLGIFLLMAACTFSTPESSRNLCVLVCALVWRGMEPNQQAGVAG
jgi:hypothetical protein